MIELFTKDDPMPEYNPLICVTREVQIFANMERLNFNVYEKYITIWTARESDYCGVMKCVVLLANIEGYFAKIDVLPSLHRKICGGPIEVAATNEHLVEHLHFGRIVDGTKVTEAIKKAWDIASIMKESSPALHFTASSHAYRLSK